MRMKSKVTVAAALLFSMVALSIMTVGVQANVEAEEVRFTMDLTTYNEIDPGHVWKFGAITCIRRLKFTLEFDGDLVGLSDKIVNINMDEEGESFAWGTCNLHVEEPKKGTFYTRFYCYSSGGLVQYGYFLGRGDGDYEGWRIMGSFKDEVIDGKPYRPFNAAIVKNR